MKKYKKFLYAFLIIVIIILGLFLYTNISRGNSENQQEKTLAEVEYLEKKIVTLLNELNNIESRNYNLSVSEISEEQSSSQTDQSSETDSTSSENTESEQNSQEQGQESSNTSSSESQNNEEYSLSETGILTNTSDIDWDSIKTEVENLYSSVPTITLDLYGQDLSKEDILGFNQELDNLTIAVQEENKENTLSSLSTLYDYIPKFADKVTDNTIYKAVISTKSNLFKAYSKLDSENWDEISNNVTQTIESYSNLLVNTDVNSSKQYNINKIYIMLNELQNAVSIQNTSIFLIKYKNILEEMNNL